MATAGILLELIEIAEEEHNVKTIDELLKFQNSKIKNYKPVQFKTNNLEKKINNLPEEPGVYQFLDNNGNILYIGKAKSLRDRVRSYFYNETITSKKISEMTKLAADIKWVATDTELTALLLESRKIKEFQPPYNTADKIYKKYPFLKLTTKDLLPKLEICHKIENDGAEYFGPFQSMALVQTIIQAVEKRFKLRKCDAPEKVIDGLNCFYYQIKRCDAACVNQITKEEYMLEVDKVRNFLGGYSEGIIQQLETKMTEFAENLNFEKAALVKNQIFELKRLFDRKNKVPASINNNNVVFIHPASEREKTVEVFMIKEGRLVNHQLLGRKQRLNDWFKDFDKVFFSEERLPFDITLEETNDIRIINSWTYRKQNSGRFIYVNGRNKNELKEEIEKAIRSISFNNLED